MSEEKLDRIIGQLSEVRSDTKVQAEQITNINEKLGRGQKAFDDIRSHLRQLNGTTVKLDDCNARKDSYTNIVESIQGKVDKQSRLIYFILAAVLLGSGTLAGSDKLAKLLKLILG